MKKLLKIIKKIGEFLTLPQKWKNEAINAGILDYSGQGKNKYGK